VAGDSRDWRALALAGLFLVATASGIAGLLVSLGAENTFTGGHDMAADAVRRYAPMRHLLLSRGIREIGYTSAARTVDLYRGGAFFRAQYALTPEVVWPNIDREYVVGDSISPDALERLKLQVVEDFGDRLLLLRRR
jgi:hypothetical protein